MTRRDGRPLVPANRPLPDDGRRRSVRGALRAADEHRLIELAAAVRRALQPRTSDPHLIEDITQETMVRVAAAQRQLEPGALRAYAIVTARNVLIAHHRSESVAKRHAHRVVDYTTLSGAEELTLEREETNALAQALEALDETDRRILLDHESNDISVAALAARDGTTPGAMAMRLARSRALLRLEFLLTFRRVTLPTDHCRQVLLAMSAGDQRRQTALGASAHLLTCETCSQLSEPLVERRRGAAAWWILPIPAWLHRGAARFRSSRTVQAATVATVVAALLFGAYLLTNGPPAPGHSVPAAQADAPSVPSTNLTSTSASATAAPSVAPASTAATSPATTTPPVPASTTSTRSTATAPAAGPPVGSPATVPAGTPPVTASTSSVVATSAVSASSNADPSTVPVGTTPAPSDTNPASPSGAAAGCPPIESSATSAPVPGCRYRFRSLPVTDVPADEGFWVTYPDGAPMWVHLEGTGESPEHVRPGTTVTIDAVVVPVSTAADAGVPASQADRLMVRGVYLAVRFADLTVDSADTVDSASRGG